jgi:hypothetical protein
VRNDNLANHESVNAGNQAPLKSTSETFEEGTLTIERLNQYRGDE